MRTRWLALMPLLIVAGCGDNDNTPAPADTGDTSLLPDADAEQEDAAPPACTSAASGACLCGDVLCDSGAACLDGHCASCEPVSGWSSGAPLFREVTDDWGLAGVEGVRVNVLDADADGWTDVFVRRSIGAWQEDDGPRQAWLLRNNEGSGFEDLTAYTELLTARSELGGRGRPVDVTAFGDVDNNGYPDAYMGNSTATEVAERPEVLLNEQGELFWLPANSDVQSIGSVDTPAGAAFVDVDRDGFLDLWEPRNGYDTTYQGDRLLRGTGDGGFTDISDDAGVVTEDWADLDDLNAGLAHTRAWGALARDLNNDGLPELLAPSYGRSPNHLWRATDPGVYVNESVASGYAFDDDLSWQDNEFARCYCDAQPDAEGCDAVGAPRITCDTLNWNHSYDRMPFRLGGNSGATLAGDLDNDGDLDLVTTEIKHWWAGSGADGSQILRNDSVDGGSIAFTRLGRDESGLEVPHATTSWDEGHMSGALFDADNDGRLDIYIGASDYPGNYGLLYHQQVDGSFALLDVGDYFEHNRSHGVGVADFDHDGDLDLIVGHSRARCDAAAPNNCYDTSQVRMFENVGADGHWIALALTGAAGTNRQAIGARVDVRYGEHTQRLEVDGGHGHYGAQSDPVLHVGLGEACEAEVTIHWPDAADTTETYTLFADRAYAITQGSTPTLAWAP